MESPAGSPLVPILMTMSDRSSGELNGGLSPAQRPTSLTEVQHQVVRVTVIRDGGGYGMKVSGDKPVYVQSVKEGGAAERAGLQSGDKIIKVNGVTVVALTHTEVVQLIKASHQVELIVQQSLMGSSPVSDHLHGSARITGPQPVDNEVQHQLLVEREQQYRMMIEKEQQYVDKLRGQLATLPQDQKRATELTKAERNLRNLQLVLQKILEKQRFQSPLAAAMSPLSSPGLTPNNNNNNNPVPPVLPPRRHQSTPVQDLVVDNSLYTEPPPLPPRAPVVGGGGDEPNSINKQLAYPLVATCATLVNDDRRSQRRHHRHSGGQRHQPIGVHHQRTKSSPDSLLGSVAGLRSPIVGSTLPTPAEASRRLIASESLSDLNWDGPPPPPGTPPPPYPPREEETALPEFSSVQTDEEDGGGSPVRAATVQAPQPAIISMEDDELSDQEMAAAAEEYGPFKSISRLWEHLPHLAVFANYILTNSQPDCLLFYLLTDLYKEGSSAKEMRKWAFELHSCFLVPGAPLRLPNVDENVAREIDDVLVKEYDKEEILRKVFWKARSRAKEELSRQLQEFKAKRVAGLGTMWGPPDNQLNECYLDRAREQRLYEQLFSDKLQPYHQDQDSDPRRHYTMAGIATVAHRLFGVQSPHGEEGPMFVSKERSLRTRLMGGGGGGGQQRHLPRKLQVLGHQFVAQQYYQVLSCNHCQQIIFGIGPQGYQCAACLINLHRGCVKRYEDACPGPISKRDRGSGLGKFIRMRHQDPASPAAPSTAALAHDAAAAKRRNNEKERRLTEERDGFTELPSDNFGETARSPGSGQQTPAASRESGASVTRSGSDRRPDLVREHRLQQPDGGGPSPLGSPPQGHQAENPAASIAESPAGVSQAGGDLSSRSSAASSGSKRKNSTNINRSESVKEVGEKRKQRRNISDPSHNNTSSVDIEHGQHQHRTGLHQTSLSDSGNSSNSNISTSGGDNSTEALPSGPASSPLAVNSDSDADPCEPVDWQRLVTEEQLRQLQPHEKKRQDVINELFQTESSHVRSLKVLYKVFYRTLQEHGSLRQEELQLVFGNIKEVLEVHRRTDAEMRRRRREDPLVGQLGELLVGVFDDRLRRAAAAFCERQQRALEFIKERRKRDSKLEAVLSECERNRKCRRLPLQGILPVEMQRLSKYPLLIERLIDAAAGSEEETAALRRAHQLSKDILNHVNEAAKVARNHDRLEEIQRHLDTSAYERTLAGGGVPEASVGGASDVDLTRYSLVHEGPMQLRRPTKAPVPVHILLLEEAVVLLQREGDRYVLKFFQSGSPAQTQPLSPIIRMSTLLVRTNAVHKSALFLVNTSTNNSQMYDLVAEDDHKRDQWFKHFSDAADAYNRREGKSRRPESGNSMIDVQDEEEPPPPPPSHHRRTASRSGDGERVQELAPPPEGAVAAELAPSAELTPAAPSAGDPERDGDEGVTADAEDGVVETGDETGPEEWPLVQPSQVRIASPPVHVAELRLTPLERLRRKDEEIALALSEKERLVGELLGIPVEHYEEIADMAEEDTGGGDMAALALAAWRRVLELERAIGHAQTEHITEARCVAAASPGAVPVCAAETEAVKAELPTVSTAKLAAVVGPLRSHITALMSAVKRAEEEREQYRREVHRLRERLHSEDLLAAAVAPPLPVDETVSETHAAEEPDQREPEETKNGELSERAIPEENPDTE